MKPETRAAAPAASAEKQKAYKAAILISSDKAYAGERRDESGPLIREVLEQAGFTVSACTVLPDEQDMLEAGLIELCAGADIVVTSGGTGFSARDIMPEATAAVAQRLAPGVSEAMRAMSLAKTPRAMLSRGITAIRGETVIVNLPGSPNAARECLAFVIESLRHGLDTLKGACRECASGKTPLA